ncbi:FAD-binding oxidoreductase [Roseinatronobacter sp. S2]|uniref:NAD(P)/FAD-dependent oxidoreductase n=1 Tax=Roseinatronobacter sp. S2 TaxID=3035471 RepID=UPI00240F3707|nr:FAD-binding oxidoreductase [Roseinatronobacter sp. S2]WFE74718.1 FAD-binding oxidoreductase [Roseinatronobacter sp. S2]
MTNTSSPRRVGIIGGGIFGVATAWFLARAGVEIILLNDGPLANGASNRSIAWLNSANRRSAEYHALRMLGMDRWRSFRAHRPESHGFLRFDGGLRWKSLIDGATLHETLKYEQGIGYDSQWLDCDQIAQKISGVDPSSIKEGHAIYNPGEGWVDLPSVISLMARELRARGATLVENAGKSDIVTNSGKVSAVRTAAGDLFEVDAALLATGPSVPEAVRELGMPMGDDSPVSLLILTKPIASGLRCVLNTPRAAIRPAVNNCLAIDSGWVERAMIIHDDGSFEYSDETVQTLLQEAEKLIIGNPKLQIDHVGVGRKPIPGGGEPVAGALGGIEGYYVAFSHSGATLGLILPELLAREILTGEISPLFANFRPTRYADDVRAAQ